MAYESHTKVGEKMKILIERLKELWEGKKEDDKKKKKDPSVVKVTQPISRAGMPTQHVASRADYLNSPNAMSSPTQMLPPLLLHRISHRPIVVLQIIFMIMVVSMVL